MKICKKFLTILLISLILLYSIIPSKIVFADGDKLNGSAEAGQIIANFARDMVANHSNETIYDYGNSWNAPYIKGTTQKNPYYYKQVNYGRLQAYRGNKTTGYAEASPKGGSTWVFAQDKYFMDCVGFVSFCIHHSLGISGNSDGNFVVPGAIRSTSYFENKTGSAMQPGDIMYSSGHVMIYLGNNTYAESSDINNPGWHIKFRSGPVSGFSVARIKDSAAKTISRSQTKNSWDGQGTSGGSGIGAPEVDDSAEFDKYIGEGNLNGLGDSNKFYYNGIPKSGEYLGKTKDGNWLFEKIEDAADWLLGFITMGIKAQAIGWTNIFESLANTVVEAVTNEDLDERITVEDIIYNKVPVLDVNLFNFKSAGGQDIEQDNIIYILRAKIASWYVVVRTTCIILLLFTLIYLGIRTAISSVAKDKAEYKQKLIGWLVGFIVVMFIHYFMVIVLNLNQIAINWVAPKGSASLIYEQMRSYAYEIPATKGWTGTIMYVFLVYYLIKMLLYYFKRLLIVYILAILSPAMGILYTIQRIKGKSKALGMWMREFAFNVLIQFIHAIIYTIMMGVIVDMISKFTVWELIPYAILLLVSLNFLLKAEDIIKNIFKIEANSLKSVLQTMFDLKGRFAMALTVLGISYGVGKKLAVNAYNKNLTSTLNTKYDKYKMKEDSEIAKSVNAEIERLKEQEKEHIKEADSNAIKFAKSQFGKTVALVGGVPAIFEKPGAGLLGEAYLVGSLDDSLTIGKYGKNAKELEKTTEGSQYIYIEPQQDILNSGNSRINSSNSTVGSSGSRVSSNANNSGGTMTESTVRPTIRTYNKKKNKKFTAKNVALGSLSWATIGRSKTTINAFNEGRKEAQRIERVYSTRIEKLSVIGKMAVGEMKNLEQELDKIKTKNSPPIYYTPKENENKTKVAMDEKLREKYRKILQKNIVQIYDGIDEGEIEDRVVNLDGDKVTLKTIESIAKEYLSQNECNLGSEFKNNLNNVLTEKLIDTVNERKTGFEKIQLKEQTEEKVRKIAENNKGNYEKLKEEVNKSITQNEKNEVVSKLSVKDLTELISKTLETKGSIEINRDFKNLQEPIENLKLLNNEAEATTGNKMYTTEQLLDLIMNKDIIE